MNDFAIYMACKSLTNLMAQLPTQEVTIHSEDRRLPCSSFLRNGPGPATSEGDFSASVEKRTSTTGLRKIAN